MVETVSRPRIAIACQGGGSHAAFTAGVLERLLAEDLDIVALSGTSGGAVCAVLAWNGLAARREAGGGLAFDAAHSLRAFWRDNAAASPLDRAVNASVVGATRWLGNFVAPEVSPYFLPPFADDALRRLLWRHGDWDRFDQRSRDSGNPMLLMSAVDVLSGEFRTFHAGRPPSHQRTVHKITLKALLASAAVPTLTRAVEIDGALYWDGLFSQNPPVRELLDARPEELWVIRINPQTRAREPMLIGDIRDRRNELEGNLSLAQELHFIRKVNELLRDRLLSEEGQEKYKYVEVREIAIGDVEAERLDYESKLDRDRAHIEWLIAHGAAQAESFLKAMATRA
jgi:NTE family protein